MRSTSSLLALLGCVSSLLAAETLSRPSVTFVSPPRVSPRSAANIVVEYSGPVDGEITLAYGPCEHAAAVLNAHQQVIGATHIGAQPLAGRHADHEARPPAKFVWLTPNSMAGGCLRAFLGEQLIGQSPELEVSAKPLARRRKMASFADVAGDEGQWFRGVHYLQQKQPEDFFVAAAKAKSLGILGGGMSGLTTALMLDSVGIHNWKILESSQRVGGRIRTVYLNGTSHEAGQYHELGPMRFPYEITDAETNETFPINDQRMVFQLADVLNKLNKGNDSLQVTFWDWIQTSPNTAVDTPFRRSDGTVPGTWEVANDPKYYSPTEYNNKTAAEAAIKALADFKQLDSKRIKMYATDIFAAYKQAVQDGMFDYSEVSYLRDVLKVDLNTTDEVTPSNVYWPMWEYETVYFLASRWKTIKGGLARLPAAFDPLIKGRIQYGAKVNGLKFNEANKTLTVSWKPTHGKPFDTNNSFSTFDYVLNSVPLNLQKFWDMPPYSSLLKRSIDRTIFGNACKVAVQFKTRFWGHLERPILGGCTRLHSPQLGQVYYPGWNLNATGPGTMLASYLSDAEATVACAMPEAEHLAYIKRSFEELHGKAVIEENWTGNYARQCWEQDEHHAGAFTMQINNQQQLYLPAFYRTEFNTVFIGEAATFTHTWMFSALESAARGTVELLLDMGLVDEAKQITNTWMARWIDL